MPRFSLCRRIVIVSSNPAWISTYCITGILGAKQPNIWFDLFSDTDWLCADIPGHKARYGELLSRKVEFTPTLFQRLSGQTHMHYYHTDSVLQVLAAPIPAGVLSGQA